MEGAEIDPPRSTWSVSFVSWKYLMIKAEFGSYARNGADTVIGRYGAQDGPSPGGWRA